MPSAKHVLTSFVVTAVMVAVIFRVAAIRRIVTGA